MDPLVVAVVLLAVWLGLLTAAMLWRRRERDEAVYRRLPNGRIRFEWSVAQAYESARREVSSDVPGPGRRTR